MQKALEHELQCLIIEIDFFDFIMTCDIQHMKLYHTT